MNILQIRCHKLLIYIKIMLNTSKKWMNIPKTIIFIKYLMCFLNPYKMKYFNIFLKYFVLLLIKYIFNKTKIFIIVKIKTYNVI